MISFHFFPKQKKWSKNALAPFQAARQKWLYSVFLSQKWQIGI